MAVTQWATPTPGFVAGAPHAMPGLVMNGGTSAPTPQSGRGYPRK